MNWTLATNFLIALLAIANPVGKVPVWIHASKHDTLKVQWRLAILLTLISFVILVAIAIQLSWKDWGNCFRPGSHPSRPSARTSSRTGEWRKGGTF